MRTATLLIALLSYTLFLISVFRVTYDSALQSTVSITRAWGPPISEIAVIVIIDGLGQRAWDYTISNRSSMLKNITNKYGISGIVKANAPTESRPRHTAVFAGFEEDIANIKTGWSKSFQPFESVFNNVDASWAFGSESVPKYFDANIRRMSHTNSPSDAKVYEDFLKSADSIAKELSSQNDEVNKSTRGKIVFFNFASTDLADHIGGYSTPEYLEAVIQADAFVYAVFDTFQRELPEELMNVTTFIVTSDHGVLKFGGHGGDSVSEAYVPIFLWGSGIVRGQSGPPLETLDSKSGYPILLNQVDICPLIAGLLGIRIPTNSMGRLPVDVLDISPPRKLELLLANNRHLWSLLEATIERTKSTSFFPFLTAEREEPWKMKDLFHETEQLIREHKQTENRLIRRLHFYRWFAWWTFGPLWLSIAIMISLSLIAAALMHGPSSEEGRCLGVKCALVFVLLVECLRATFASPRELTSVALLCLLAHTFLDGTVKCLRRNFKNYLPIRNSTTDAPTSPTLGLGSAMISISFFFMLSGFYVKPLFCLSVLSTLAAQIISVKLSRTFLTYLCVVSTSLVSCILLIEHFRNQENYPSEVLMFIKAFGLLTMGLWIAGNVLIARKLAGCVPEKAGYSSVLAHNMYTTLLANVQFLLALSVYLFGLDLFSDMARKISSRLWQKLPSIGVMLSGVIPILLLVVSHVKTRVWQRRSIGSGHQSLQSLNAITMFWLFLISQSFCLFTMRGHGSWAEIGASLAYTLIVPTFCLLAGLLFLTL